MVAHAMSRSICVAMSQMARTAGLTDSVLASASTTWLPATTATTRTTAPITMRSMPTTMSVLRRRPRARNRARANSSRVRMGRTTPRPRSTLA